MANFNFNKVILGGRLTADPELKTTPSGAVVTSFSIAVNRRFGGKNGEEPQADFINVTAWRTTAEFITRYFRKGSSICVVGSIQTRSWTDQNGNKRYATDVVADEAMFVDAKNEGPAAHQAAPAYGQATSYMPEGYSSFGGQGGAPVYNNAGGATAPKFEEFTDDDDLPF
jgi:single-strand DNA-binding protein